MTENRRIFWNIIATYGRSLYSLAVGLFTARWALNALGVTDYGLYGVVGGLTAFISFLNGTLAGANSRFYAFAIGQARAANDKDVALEECRKWFNTAFSIHTIVPLMLIAIGYPAGEWAIRNFLTIPLDRIQDCVWVFRLSCLTCFIGMVNVPFGAMYGAKQYIAELTIYSYFTTTLNAFFLYYMITHPGVWLVKYAIWGCLIANVPALVICVRAMLIFPECHVRFKYMWDWCRIKEVGAFAGWTGMGGLCSLLRINGVAVLVNKAFGPQVNAANALGNAVNGHTAALSSSLIGAFTPAITTAFGEGKLDKMRLYALRACKFGCLLQLLFLVPLMAELPNVLEIWLKTPPEYTAFLCYCALIMHFIQTSNVGCYAAVSASGHVKKYQISMTYISILTLPICLLVVWLGGGVYGLGITLICVRISISLRCVYYSRLYAGLSARRWVRKVVIPLAIAIIVAGGVSLLPQLFLPASFLRIVVTTLISEMVLLPLTWFVLLDEDERGYVRSRLKGRIPFLK